MSYECDNDNHKIGCQCSGASWREHLGVPKWQDLVRQLDLLSPAEVKEANAVRNRAHRLHTFKFKAFGRRFWFGCELIEARRDASGGGARGKLASWARTGVMGRDSV